MLQFQAAKLETVKSKLSSLGAESLEVQNDAVLCRVERDRIHDFVKTVRDDAALDFRFFTDITGADYSKYSIPQPGRFAVIYSLLSISNGVRLQITVFLPENDPSAATVSDLFTGANWAEREVFDMYGIVFKGHPDLKRLLTPEDYEGHPLRKDYPLKGRGERASFEVYSAVPGHN
ncbi:MAG: NADH-quinone oxidoreductase subunit C [Leptospirales bacterium]|nr:NADH-quinone oxidoreductase subunit C [Leptospirales bacterium]